MKIAISCVSPLVQSSLEFFLKDYLTSEGECDFIITDDERKQSVKPLCFVIDAEYSHIRKPFNISSLNEDIQAFCEKIQYSSKNVPNMASKAQSQESFSPPIYTSKKDDLESRIRAICEEYARELADKIIASLKA